MTLTDTTVVAPPTEAPVAPIAPPRPTRAPLRRRVTAITVVVLLVGASAWLLFSLFQGPGAAAWYESRQRALTADYLSAREHAGAGHAIAVMQIPKIGVNVVVAENDSPEQLRGGPGHRIGTVAPGTLGNSVISGHREDWGGPFERLDELEPGLSIVVETQTPDGLLQYAYYEVTRVDKVDADDLGPFATSKDFRLTLISGDGGRYSDDRIVVTAVSGDVKNASTRARGHGRDDVVGTRTPTNPAARLAVVAFAAALGVWLFLRRRYHRAIAIGVVVPIVVLGLLGVLLTVDLYLPVAR